MVTARKIQLLVLVIFGIVMLVLTMLFLVRIAHAQSVPTIISHQGRLLNASNQPVTSNVSVEFKIYDALTGGTQVWTETQSITPDNLGFYDTFLGGVTALPSSLPNPSYLQITVQSETLSPRLQFGSVPFAQKAGISTDLDCPGCVGTSDIADAAVTSQKVKPILETKEFAFTFTNATQVSVPESTINITTNVPSKLLALSSTYIYGNSSTSASAIVWIEVDGTALEPRAWVYPTFASGGSAISTLSTHAVANVGNGTHTIKIRVYADNASSIQVYSSRLTVEAFAQ